MKLTLNNIGRIKYGEIDVRPLTVLVGPNNTNKTWSAYTLYGLATSVAGHTFSTATVDVRILDPLISKIEKLVSTLLPMLSDETSTETRSELNREQITRDLMGRIAFDIDSGGIGSVLAIEDFEARHPNASAALELGEELFDRPLFDKVELNYNNSDRRFEYNLFSSLTGPRPLSRFSGFAGPATPIESDPATSSLSRLLREALVRLGCSVMTSVVALPAERIALVSLFQGMGFRERMGRLQRLSLPVRDFVEIVLSFPFLPTLQSKGDPSDLADLLEKRILQGSFEFQEQLSGAGRTPSRRLRYAAAEGVSLDVQAAASMVKSLAGLDLYLSTFVIRNSLLIIDEPEMNAHPEAQLKIIELLAILAARGLYVVITTHSPYITDHLINLMQASRLSPTIRESVRERFKLGSTEAFLDPEKVSVYHFSEGGNVQSVLSRDDALIDLSSFSNPSEYTSNLYSVLLEAERDIISPKLD